MRIAGRSLPVYQVSFPQSIHRQNGMLLKREPAEIDIASIAYLAIGRTESALLGFLQNLRANEADFCKQARQDWVFLFPSRLKNTSALTDL